MKQTRNIARNEITIEGKLAYIHIESPTFGHKVAIIDAEDVDKIKNHRWAYQRLGYITTNVPSSKPGRRYDCLYLHKLIIPSEFVVDHKNRNPSDCRKENLRHGRNERESRCINNNNRTVNKNSAMQIKGIKQRSRNSIEGRARTYDENHKVIAMFTKTGANVYMIVVALNKWRTENSIGYVPMTPKEMVEATHWIKNQMRLTA